MADDDIDDPLQISTFETPTAGEASPDQDVAATRLRRGTSQLVSQRHLRRDPRFWSDYERLDLDPARLSDPAAMPFGLGGAACLDGAMSELRKIAWEFAVVREAGVVTADPHGPPEASVTLVSPKIQRGIRMRPAAAARAAA